MAHKQRTDLAKQPKDSKSLPLLSTNVTAPSGMLTAENVLKAMDEFKKKPLIKEVRVKNMRFKVDVTSDEPLTPLQELYGVPIVVDSTIPNDKVKFIYADGKEVVMNIGKDGSIDNG
jgi:hypothetical protein